MYLNHTNSNILMLESSSIFTQHLVDNLWMNEVTSSLKMNLQMINEKWDNFNVSEFQGT